MTIIIFLVDTSASMNQRTYMGTTLLDITKNAIEMFQKIRSKNPNSKWDRLMLLTFDEPPGNVKAGWKETHLQFATQLKNLEAHSVTDMGSALKNSFDMLNMNRNQSGIDTYGQGRCPYYIEPALIICFTDGQALVTNTGLQKQLTLPMINGIFGSELTKEPFRWDQRVFGVVLKIPAVEPTNTETADNLGYVPTAESCPLDSMCEVTGGRSYTVGSQKQLAQTLESIAQKAAMHGVVVNFEFIENVSSMEDNNPRPATPTNSAWKSTKRMIFVPRSAQRGHSVGHWPIPEAFWPDSKAKSLPPRDAQPVIKFSSASSPPLPALLNNLPIDLYELEPNPLTQHILKNGRNVVYQTFIAQSSKYSEHPFGFLQANSNQKVVLHVMPYNYPVLINLLDDLQKSNMKPSPKWKADFENYLRSMPAYYAPYLRRALGRMNIHNIVPETMDNCMSFAVGSHLKQVRLKAKQEYDGLVASVGQVAPSTDVIQVINKNSSSLLARQDFHDLLQYTGGDYSSIASMQKELVKYESFPIAVPRPNSSSVKTFNYKNPYDIARSDLLSQIAKLRACLLQPNSEANHLLKHEHLHNIPIQRMGNYHEYLAKTPQPLRPIDTQPERLHTFGNPFKVNKGLMIDEADEAMPGMALPGSSSSKRKRSDSESMPNSPARKKRKPGPLPRHITLTNRPTTPPIRPLSPTESLTDSEEPELAILEKTSPMATDVKQEVVVKELNGVVNGISPTQFKAKIVQHNDCSFDDNETRIHNEKLRCILLREAKRPGKNYDVLFQNIKTIKGSKSTRLKIIERVMLETQRFKRTQLSQLLMDYKQTVANHNEDNYFNFNLTPEADLSLKVNDASD